MVSATVMVPVAVSILGTTELIEPDVKLMALIIVTSCSVCTSHLRPAIRSIAGDFHTFYQENAPALRAGVAVEFLSRNTPDFTSPLLWPPSSPDLNSVDYEVWGVLQ